MTPTRLQDCLVNDFKQELSNFLLKNVKDERANFNIYAQSLPAKKGQKDSEHFPYVVIRVIEGEEQEDQEETKNTCQITFIAGIYDESDDYQGDKDVLNVIEKIIYRLKTKKYYDNRFELTTPMKWLIYDENAYPYYFGGIETHWKMPVISMDDPLI